MRYPRSQALTRRHPYRSRGPTIGTFRARQPCPACACICKGRVSVCVCMSLGYRMPVERLYIYRRGMTNACALQVRRATPFACASRARSLAILAADQLSPDRRWSSWFCNGDSGDADRRQGLLPFHRLGQVTRNSTCCASRCTTRVDHCYRHRSPHPPPNKAAHDRRGSNIRDLHCIQFASAQLGRLPLILVARTAPRNVSP